MNKLGLRIYRFQAGPFVTLTVNGEEDDWTKKVVDIRDILKLYKEDVSKSVMFMSFSESGAYITIARLISGRTGDNIAAWIYIPNTIDISGDEMIRVIDVVKKELSASKSNEDLLKQTFSKTYQPVEAADYSPSSPQKKYAKRNVGIYQLKHLIGEKRYQPVYANYNAILIQDNDSMDIEDKNVVDLSKQPLVETMVFCPPVKSDIPNDVTIHFNDRNKGYPRFERPIRVLKSERFDLLFKRKGFEDIRYIGTVEENNQICGIPRYDWNVPITRDNFYIYDEEDPKKNLTSQAAIKVNGVELKWNMAVPVPENKADKVQLTIKVDGYEKKEGQVNLLNRTKPMHIKLKRAECSRTWRIELKNGQMAEMTLASKYLPKGKGESPLKGYSVSGISELEYTDFAVWAQRLYGFGAGALLILLVWGCFAIFGGDEPVKPNKQQPANTEYPITSKQGKLLSGSEGPRRYGDNPASSVTPVGKESPDKTIAYLDNKAGVWHRDSLNKYPELRGLFHHLNHFEFEKIKARTDLAKSKNFSKILEVINARKGDKTVKNKKGKRIYNYTSEEDTVITVKTYLDIINPVKPKPKESESGTTDPGTTQASDSVRGKI